MHKFRPGSCSDLCNSHTAGVMDHVLWSPQSPSSLLHEAGMGSNGVEWRGIGVEWGGKNGGAVEWGGKNVTESPNLFPTNYFPIVFA